MLFLHNPRLDSEASGLVLWSKLLIVASEPVEWKTAPSRWILEWCLTLSNPTTHQNIKPQWLHNKTSYLINTNKLPQMSSHLHQTGTVRLKNRTEAKASCDCQGETRNWHLKQDLKPHTNCSAQAASFGGYPWPGLPELGPPGCLSISSFGGDPSPQWPCWSATNQWAKRSVRSKRAARTMRAAGASRPDGQVLCCLKIRKGLRLPQVAMGLVRKEEYPGSSSLINTFDTFGSKSWRQLEGVTGRPQSKRLVEAQCSRSPRSLQAWQCASSKIPVLLNGLTALTFTM